MAPPYRKRHPETDYGNLGSEYTILGNPAITQDTATVTIYKEGTNYIARKGTNGDIISSNSDFSTVCNAAGAWITGNGVIFVKDPGTDIVVPSTITFTNKEIYVTSDLAKLDFSGLNNIAFLFQDTVNHGILSCGISNFRVKGDVTKTSQTFVKFSEVIARVENIVGIATEGVYQLVFLSGACPGSIITHCNIEAFQPIEMTGDATNNATGSVVDGNNFICYYSQTANNIGIKLTYGKTIKISNNRFYTIYKGITATGSDHLQICNNYINGATLGCDINGTYPLISNNYFYLQTTPNTGIKLYSSYGGVITGNIFYTWKNDDNICIYLDTVERVAITGNYIAQDSDGYAPTGCSGIYINGGASYLTITGNIFNSAVSITATAINCPGTLADSCIVSNAIFNFTTKITIGTSTRNEVAHNTGDLPHSYTLTFSGATLAAPVDSTIYYYGGGVLTPPTVANLNAVCAPRAGTIKAAIFRIYCTAGSAENVVMVIRKNNTTDYTFDTKTMNATPVIFSNYALDIPVAAGDSFEFKMTTPAWVTNPADLRPTGSILIEYQ